MPSNNLRNNELEFTPTFGTLQNHDTDPMKYIEIPRAYLSDKEKTYCALRVLGNSMSPRVSDGDIVVIHESADIQNLHGKICACQTPDGITLKKLQLDEEKKRVLLRPLNQEYDVIVLEEYELETFRILGEMALLFRVV